MVTPLRSLEFRIGLMRRRRHVSLIKQVLAVTAPELVGISLLLLLAGAGNH